jgi:acetyltransferase-like isoleucine patch superfamily enzyme
MTGKRLWQTIRLWSMMSSVKRVNYLRKNHIFGEIGKNVTIMDRKIPLYAKLIRVHNNVRIASNVTFATHDVTHLVLKKLSSGASNLPHAVSDLILKPVNSSLPA